MTDEPATHDAPLRYPHDCRFRSATHLSTAATAAWVMVPGWSLRTTDEPRSSTESVNSRCLFLIGLLGVSAVHLRAGNTPPESLQIRARPMFLDGSGFSYDAATFRWRRDGTVVATGSDAGGDVTNTLALAATDAPATYTFEVTNAYGTTTSEPYGVPSSRPEPPWISRQTNAIRLRDSNSTVAVWVIGTGPFTITWYRNGTAVDGPKTADAGMQVLYPTQHGGAGDYTLTASTTSGTATSLPVHVVADDGATFAIDGQPEHHAVPYGEELSLSIAVTAPGPVTYQWYRDGAAIAGATSSGYGVASYTPAYAGHYAVVVTSGGATLASNEAVVTTHGRTTAAPQFLQPPASATLHTGDTITLGATADAGHYAVWQWQKDGQTLVGATGPTLCLPVVSAADAGAYTVEVTNEFGTTRSPAANVTVTAGNPPTMAPLIFFTTADRYVDAGGEVTLTARVAGTPAPTLQWFHDGTPIAGANGPTLTFAHIGTADAGSYRLEATNSAGNVGANLGRVFIHVPDAAPRFLMLPPAQRRVTLGETVTLTVQLDGNPEPTLLWLKDGAPITLNGSGPGTSYTGANPAKLPGLTLRQLGADAAGDYTVRATNPFGTVESTPIHITVVPPPASGLYFADSTLSSTPGPFAGGLLIGNSGTGVMISNGYRSQLSGGLGSLTVGSDGSFTGTEAPTRTGAAAIDFVGQSRLTGFAVLPREASGWQPLMFNRAALSGPFEAYAGHWSAPLVGGSTGTAEAIIGADGEAVLLINRTDGVNESASGKLDANGTFSNDLRGVLRVQFAADGTFAGSMQSWTQPAVTFAGRRDNERLFPWLANISTRARAGGSAGTMIAGFAISGSSPHTVLIRAVGPTLGDFGVASALADPHLQLYRGSDVIASNDNWSGDSDLVDTMHRVRAFDLPTGSRDAALLATLNPGVYTALVDGATGSTDSGVALVEVYDATSTAKQYTEPRLVNVSSRAYVGTGDDVLIAGFVVLGNAPKRVLLRAVGPGLAPFGVAGVLPDPVLRLFDGSGTEIEENDDGDFSDTGEVATASRQVHAFSLDVGARDSAMVVTLSPGLYTAQVSGFENATGVALVEAYELP